MLFQYVIYTKDHITHTTSPVTGHVTHIMLPVTGHVTHITSPVTGHVTHITPPVTGHVTHITSPVTGHVIHITSPAVTCHCTMSSFTNIWYVPVYNKIHRQQIATFGQHLANKVEVQYTLYKQSYSVHRPII